MVINTTFVKWLQQTPGIPEELIFKKVVLACCQSHKHVIDHLASVQWLNVCL